MKTVNIIIESFIEKLEETSANKDEVLSQERTNKQGHRDINTN